MRSSSFKKLNATFDMRKLMYVTVLRTTKQSLKMAESKVIITILNLVLYPLYGYTLFINFDNIKGWILTALAVVFAIVRIYFYVVQKKQAIREKEYHLRELDRKDRAESSN